MTLLGAAALGFLVFEVIRAHSPRGVAAAGAASSSLVVAAPASLVPVAAGWLAAWIVLRRFRRSRTSRAARPDRLGQVLYVALSAGLPIAAALAFAAGEVQSDVATELRSVLRVARQRGLANALSESTGTAGPLLGALARAQLTGSSSLATVEAFVEEDRKARRARAIESARKLPVKLTVPLALLILPGFVLIAVGPTVVMTVHRLLGPLLR